MRQVLPVRPLQGRLRAPDPGGPSATRTKIRQNYLPKERRIAMTVGLACGLIILALVLIVLG